MPLFISFFIDIEPCNQPSRPYISKQQSLVETKQRIENVTVNVVTRYDQPFEVVLKRTQFKNRRCFEEHFLMNDKTTPGPG
jgi:hypothetical protein